MALSRIDVNQHMVFPLEIFFKVLRDIPSAADIRSCGLVCKTWRREAHKLLSASVIIQRNAIFANIRLSLEDVYHNSPSNITTIFTGLIPSQSNVAIHLSIFSTQSLQSLTISFTSETLLLDFSFLSSCNNLKNLDLTGHCSPYPLVPAEWLSRFLDHLSNLEILNFSNFCIFVPEKRSGGNSGDLLKFPAPTYKLRTLGLNFFEPVQYEELRLKAEHVTWLAGETKQLKSLVLGINPLPQDIPKELVSNLEKFTFNFINAGRDFKRILQAEDFKNFTSIKQLSLPLPEVPLYLSGIAKNIFPNLHTISLTDVCRAEGPRSDWHMESTYLRRLSRWIVYNKVPIKKITFRWYIYENLRGCLLLRRTDQTLFHQFSSDHDYLASNPIYNDLVPMWYDDRVAYLNWYDIDTVREGGSATDYICVRAEPSPAAIDFK